MNIQSGPAETTNYLILGYSMIFGVILIHLASLRIRFRNTQADLEALDRLNRKSSRKKGRKPKKSGG